MATWKDKDYRSEEEILFASSSPDPELDKILNSGTTFAGMGKVCSESLTPNPQKADYLREQKYW